MLNNQFTIKAVSQATGLTVETLRAWERRYDVVRPARDAAGRRTYSVADVARLRLLRSAIDRGHTISRVAQLGEPALLALVDDSASAGHDLARGRNFVERALDAALHSDPAGCEEVLMTAIALLPASEVIHTVLAPLVREIGERWHRGEATIAQEHVVTDIVRRLIISVSRGIPRDAGSPCLVLSTLAGERHELGILMCSWLAAARRCQTHYLGADCPAAEIARFALEVGARAVLISLVMPENSVPAMQQLRELATRLDGGCEIWLGGSAAGHLAAEGLPGGTVVLPTLHSFEQRLSLVPDTARRI
jgi:DNA-binding transcriptional MerR regulator